jgi:hypothetical protein
MVHRLLHRMSPGSWLPLPALLGALVIAGCGPTDVHYTNPQITSYSLDVSETTVTISFSGNDDVAHFECRLDEGVSEVCISPHIYTDVAAGEHVSYLLAYDMAGNAAHWAIGFVRPPQTTIESGPSGTVDTAEAIFTFSCDAGSCEYACRLDGSHLGPDDGWRDCTSPMKYTGLSNGEHTFEVRAFLDPTPPSRTWIVDAAETIDSALIGLWWMQIFNDSTGQYEDVDTADLATRLQVTEDTIEIGLSSFPVNPGGVVIAEDGQIREVAHSVNGSVTSWLYDYSLAQDNENLLFIIGESTDAYTDPAEDTPGAWIYCREGESC